jgi:hypothetical protein
VTLAAVRDLREHRAVASEDELADLETDVLAGFVLARASAGLVDSTIRNDINHLELIRDWFGRPLWEMQPADVDTNFGKVLRDACPSTRAGRAAALVCDRAFWRAGPLQRAAPHGRYGPHQAHPEGGERVSSLSARSPG